MKNCVRSSLFRALTGEIGGSLCVFCLFLFLQTDWGCQVHDGKWVRRGQQCGVGPESIGGVMRWLRARFPWSSLSCPSLEDL